MIDIIANIVVLDFDGVIAQSSMFKHEVYLNLVKAIDEKFPTKLDKALRNELVGAERRDVVRWISANCNSDFSQDKFLEEFARKVESELPILPLVPGFKKFIDLVNKNGAHLYIASAAPGADILKYLKSKRIDTNMFRSILGSESGSKRKCCDLIVEHAKLEVTNDVVYIGDMPSDKKVAREMGFQFVRMKSPAAELVDWGADSIPTASSFDEIKISIITGG